MARLTKEQEAMMDMTADMVVCMARAARSSGVPFAELARAARAARLAFAKHRRSEWIGAVSGDALDPRNWLYGRLPHKGDAAILFDRQSKPMNANMDFSKIPIGTLIVTKAFRDAGGTIGKQGRAL